MNDQSFAAHDPLLALGDALLSPREAVTLEPILVIRVQGVELALNIVSDRRRAVKYMRRFLSEWSGHAPLTVDDRTALDPREWRFHRRDQAFLDELSLLVSPDETKTRKQDGTRCLPAGLKILGETRCLVTVREGKYHQVRRMLAAVGKPVLTLRRLSVGPLKIDPELGSGGYRELTEEELCILFNAIRLEK